MALGNPRVGGFGTNVAVGRTSRVAPPPPTPAERRAATKPRDPNPITRAWWWAGEQLDKWGSNVAGGITPKPPAPGQPYRPPIGAPGAPSPAGTSGSSGGWGGGTAPSKPPQSGQSYIDAYNNRQQAAANSAFNRGMQTSAAADRWAAEGKANYEQTLAQAAAAAAQGDYQRANALLTIGDQYNAGMADLGRRGVNIMSDTLNRQTGLINDMRNISARGYLTDIAGTAIDQRANERQFGLINAARGDLGANLAREKQRLTDVEAGIAQNENTARRQERQAQYKLFSDAAASGNVTQIARMSGKELKSSLTDNLANYQRERNQVMRDRQQADQDYQTRMRDLQEQDAQAVDAREKLNLRRQMQDLEEERQRRQQREDLADIEDQKKKNMLELMTIELQRKQQVGELGVRREETEAQRLNAWFTAVAEQQRIQNERIAAATRQYGVNQMYPTTTAPTLLPTRNSGRSAGRAANARR